MVRWMGERKCVVDKNGKEVEYNVSRLFKHHSWDEKHFDTSGIVPGAEPIASNVAKAKKNTPPKSVKGFIALPATEPRVGEVILFVLEMAPDHRSPFGVGRILAVKQGRKVTQLEFQWLGNKFYEYDKPFLNGWYNLSEGVGYWRDKKIAATDVPWTCDITTRKWILS